MNAEIDDVSSEKAAEYLRLTLPMMSRHKVPATPQNYATWYTYVAGDDPALSARMDKLIGDGRKFSAVLNAELYREFIADRDLNQIDRVRTDLGTLIKEVGASLHEAGNDAQAFEGALGGFVQHVSRGSELQGITRLLESLIAETRAMQATTNGIHEHFTAKSKEIEVLQEQLQVERQRAVTDPLTGLYNRFALLDRLGDALAASNETNPPSLIMFDIDHFKRINDSHGHLIGDRVIRFVATTLQNNVKGQDTAARFGGEEFTVLLPGTPAKGAWAVAEIIRKAVAHARLVRADTKQPLGEITVSAGIATYQKGEDDMEFINRADQALYQSKKDGRNCITIAD